MGRHTCVLLYGWLGAAKRQLRHHEKLLHRPVDVPRRVVSQVLPAGTFFGSQRHLQRQASYLADAALEASASAEKVGLFALSGNGSTAVALLLQELRRRAAGELCSSAAGTVPAQVLLERISAVIYDSGPVHVAPPVLATGFTTMLASKYGLERHLDLQRLLPASEAFFRVLMQLTGRKELAAQLYEELLLVAPVPHLLLYSEADAVIPSCCITRFAKDLQARGGNAHLQEFHEAPHVLHLKTYPDRYAEVVNRFLDAHL